MQQSLLSLFLILSGIIILVFILVYLSSIQSQPQQGMKNPLQKRFWFITIMVVVLGMFFFITIPKSPYYLYANEQPARIVHTVSSQFVFLMSNQDIDPAQPMGENIELNTNELVEFRVTSLDVTHGFGIYNDKYELVAQTQAMPGYVNKLRWKFSEPGKYYILCLEYCGSGHQVMKSFFNVK
ncbi:MAG: hypothetical protein LC111_05640 [Bacteroidia bacterium]|nr:hypothetical protein [Bacteroidia bacterium]